ncbi:MAG: hypothetical protein COB78_04555 [Hyphomicrobiales bacterium]|nr:MAG: hypothetical protein COB78_04555 [Hyphomicrobiales bacterium]
MNIVSLKKTAIAALTIAVVVTGSLSATTAPAAAGGKHFGAGLVGGLAIGLIAGGYRRDRGYYGHGRHYYDERRYYNRSDCGYEYRWSRRAHRNVRRWVCG